VTKRDPRGNPSFVTARSYSRFRSSLKDSSPLRGSEWPIRSVPASSSSRLRSNLASQMVIANFVFSPGEAISTTGLLRGFAPRKDEQKESLRASLFRLVKQSRFLPESRHCEVAVLPFSYVTARSSFRFRSSLDRQESLRASLFRLAKQSPLSPSGNTGLLRSARRDNKKAKQSRFSSALGNRETASSLRSSR